MTKSPQRRPGRPSKPESERSGVISVRFPPPLLDALDEIVAARLDGAGACGRYVLGGTVVEVDPACTMGLDGVRKAVGHELFHFVLITRFAWPGHLCRWAINERAPAGCHPTIQCPASGCLLEAGLRGAPVDGVEDYVATFADGSVTDADRELLRGCVARGRCE